MFEEFTFRDGRGSTSASGNFIKLISVGGISQEQSDKVRVFIEGRPAGTMRPGDWLELDGNVSRWDFEAATPTAGGLFLIGRGRMGTSRISGGVSVVDASIQRTAEGNQYFSSINRAAAASMYACVGIVAETKRFAIRRAIVCNGNAAAVNMFVTDGFPPGYIQKRIIRNKLLASVKADAALYSCDLTQGAPLLAGELVQLTDLGQFRMNTTSVELPLSGPIVLEPGKGFFVTSNSVANVISLLVDGEEID